MADCQKQLRTRALQNACEKVALSQRFWDNCAIVAIELTAILEARVKGLRLLFIAASILLRNKLLVCTAMLPIDGPTIHRPMCYKRHHMCCPSIDPQRTCCISRPWPLCGTAFLHENVQWARLEGPGPTPTLLTNDVMLMLQHCGVSYRRIIFHCVVVVRACCPGETSPFHSI